MPCIHFTRSSRFYWLILMLVNLPGCQDQPAKQPLDSNESRLVEGEARDQGKAQIESDSAISSDGEGDIDGATDPDSDGQYRTMVVGTWEDDYQGHRTLTIKDDGTATMVVKLRGLAATIYAKQMTFDEEWSVEDGRLKLKTVGGEPAGRVKLIIKTMGDVSEQKILELTRDRMLLRDPDGETKYDWRRVL